MPSYYPSLFSGAQVDAAVSAVLALPSSGAIASAISSAMSGAVNSQVVSQITTEVLSSGQYITSSGGAKITSDVIDQYLVDGVVARGMTISRDAHTSEATIPVLSGGTFYIYETPLSGLTINSVVNSPDDSYVKFTLASGAVVLPYNLTILNSAQQISAGSSYLFGFMANMLAVAEAVEPAPIADTAGVWLVSGDAILFSAMSATALGVSSGQTANVYSGGVLIDATVSSGGGVVISNGGQTSNTIVESGGSTITNSGGVGSGTTISGGTAIINSGGIDTATIISSGGSVVVSSGGVLSSGVVSNSGTVIINSGGTGSATTVSSGGVVFVSSGGSVTDGTVNESGVIIISSGGSYSSVTVSSGGVIASQGSTLGLITVYSGGAPVREYPSPCLSATATTGEQIVISSGGMVYWLDAAGADVLLSNGASAMDLSVAGGTLLLDTSATATNIIVSNGVAATSSHEITTKSSIISADAQIISAQLESAGIDLTDATVQITSGGIVHVTKSPVRCYMSANTVTTEVDSSLFNATQVESYTVILSPAAAEAGGVNPIEHTVRYSYEIPEECVAIYSGGSCDAYVNRPTLPPASWFPATPEDSSAASGTYYVSYTVLLPSLKGAFEYTATDAYTTSTIYEYVPVSGGVTIKGAVEVLNVEEAYINIDSTALVTSANILKTRDPDIYGTVENLSLTAVFFENRKTLAVESARELVLNDVYGPNTISAGTACNIVMSGVSGASCYGGQMLTLLGNAPVYAVGAADAVVVGDNAGGYVGATGSVTLGKNCTDEPDIISYQSNGVQVPWFFECSAVMTPPFSAGRIDRAYASYTLTVLSNCVLVVGGGIANADAGLIVVSGGTAYLEAALDETSADNINAVNAEVHLVAGGAFDTLTASNCRIYTPASLETHPTEVVTAAFTECTAVFADEFLVGNNGLVLNGAWVTGVVSANDPQLDAQSVIELDGGRVLFNGPRESICSCGTTATVDQISFTSGSITSASVESAWTSALDQQCSSLCN